MWERIAFLWSLGHLRWFTFSWQMRGICNQNFLWFFGNLIPRFPVIIPPCRSAYLFDTLIDPFIWGGILSHKQAIKFINILVCPWCSASVMMCMTDRWYEPQQIIFASNKDNTGEYDQHTMTTINKLWNMEANLL